MEELYQRTYSLCQAFGLPVINELPPERYVNAKLYRSLSGAAINEAHIPANKVELGLQKAIDPQALTAACTGVRDVLKWAGMLPSEPDKLATVPLPEPGFRVRRENLPWSDASGIIRYHVCPSDLGEAGQVLATLADIFGNSLPSHHTIVAPYGGWIMSLEQGAVCYKRQVITNMATPNKGFPVKAFPRS